MLLDLTNDDQQRQEMQAEYIKHRCNYFRGNSIDASVPTREAIQWFERQWQTLEGRLNVVPGKSLMARFRERVQDRFGVSFSNIKIAAEFRRDEISSELVTLLTSLEEFCLRAPQSASGDVQTDSI